MVSRKKILLSLILIGLPVCGNAALECYHYRQANLLRESGHEAESAGRIAESISKYEQALKIYPHFLDLYPELAELYDVSHDLKNSERCWNEAVAKAPDDARAQSLMYRMRGTFYFHHEMLALAESDLTQASCLDPSDPLAEQLLAKCRQKKQVTVLSPSGSKTFR